jgi:hypothetical protein
VAVTGITQTSLGAPTAPLFWVLLGVALQTSVTWRRVATSAAPWSPTADPDVGRTLGRQPTP